MEVVDDTTQLKTDDQIEAETKEFEFLVPLHSLVKLRPFVDRYFIKYYKTFPSALDPNVSNNQYAFCHTNKLFMIGIANDHEIVTKQMKIKKISFDKLDKEVGLAVKGKKKKGGLKVKTGEKIAEIITEEGRVFPLISLVDGNVIEINEAIEKDPNIILTEAEARGYIAIINSGLKIERYVSKLIPEQEYRALLSNDKKEEKTTEPMSEEKP